MTLEDLRIFSAVCEAQSLSAVARSLGCTQPAVSQHVARLEKELGVALLERVPRGVSLTATGRVLYEGCRTGLAAISSSVRQIEQLRDGESGTLSISTGGTTVRHFMRDAVVRFREMRPLVPIHFESASSTNECLEALRRQEADLAFVTIDPNLRGFDQRTALSLPIRLVVHPDDPLARRRRLRISELVGIRYIGLSPQTTSRGLIRQLLEAEGVVLEPTVTVDDWDTATVFVELGLGHAIIPAVQAARFQSEGRVRSIRISGLPPIEVGWAARSWQALPPAALEFVDLFSQTARAWRDIDGLQVHAHAAS